MDRREFKDPYNFMSSSLNGTVEFIHQGADQRVCLMSFSLHLYLKLGIRVNKNDIICQQTRIPLNTDCISSKFVI